MQAQTCQTGHSSLRDPNELRLLCPWAVCDRKHPLISNLAAKRTGAFAFV